VWRGIVNEEASMAKGKAKTSRSRTRTVDSVYKVADVVGTSSKSWEDAAINAVETAAGSLRDLRIAEVVKMDVKVEGGRVVAFRTRVQLSFKYES
jgi:dodecin